MRKLSLDEKLRHRLRDVRRAVPRRGHHDEHGAARSALFLALGAAAGVIAGAVIVQRYGGFDTLAGRLRSRFSPDEGEDTAHRFPGDAYHEEGEEALFSSLEALEERVLDAYRNDPVLSERAVDIGAIDDGVIELTGWVQTSDEAVHAVTVARGTPGVRTVVNRLVVRVADDAIPLKEQWMGADGGYGDGNSAAPPDDPHEDDAGAVRGD